MCCVMTILIGTVFTGETGWWLVGDHLEGLAVEAKVKCQLQTSRMYTYRFGHG